MLSALLGGLISLFGLMFHWGYLAALGIPQDFSHSRFR